MAIDIYDMVARGIACPVKGISPITEETIELAFFPIKKRPRSSMDEVDSDRITAAEAKCEKRATRNITNRYKSAKGTINRIYGKLEPNSFKINKANFNECYMYV